MRRKITETKDELLAIVMAYDYEECEGYLESEIFPVLDNPKTATNSTCTFVCPTD